MIGRHLKITSQILAKLESCFLCGHTDEEACLVAEIDPATLYRYCQKYPNFASKKELLKNNIKLLARQNIYKEIKAGNIELSKWYLERKAKEEFSLKQEITQSTNPNENEKNIRMKELASNIKTILERPK